MDTDFRHAEARQKTDGPGMKVSARLQSDGSFSDAFPTETDIPAAFQRLGDDSPSVLFNDPFSLQNSVGPARNYPARHDPAAFTRFQGRGRWITGFLGTENLEKDGLGSGSPLDLRGPQTVAVHGRNVVKGVVRRGRDVSGEHQSQSLVERTPDGGQGTAIFKDQPEGFLR
jgi:hypothetical protein